VAAVDADRTPGRPLASALRVAALLEAERGAAAEAATNERGQINQ